MPVQGYVNRLLWAEAVVFCFPTWCFGMPAMLKGFFDRVLMPGVAFDVTRPAQRQTVTPHASSASRLWSPMARPDGRPLFMGDPPRKSITRYVRLLTGGKARGGFTTPTTMNVATPPRLAAFTRVGQAMARFA